MAFDRLEIDAPSDKYAEFAINRDSLINTEKASAPDLKKSFAGAAYGATPLSAEMAQGMSLQAVINPAEPIDITPDQKITMSIDPQELNERAQMTGPALQETKMGVQTGPQKDSFFSVACNTMSNEIRGISQTLQGGPQPMMDPRMMPLQQQFTMKPASLF